VGVADPINRWQGARATPTNREYQPDISYEGLGMLFNATQFMKCGVRITDVLDGTSSTLFVGEGTGDRQVLSFTWCENVVADMYAGINGPGSLPGGGTYWPYGTGFSSYHTGGANFVMVDGSVRFVPQSISLTLLQQLSTRAGGEVACLP
jgi:prepilin-type processing-associated H-X9-DG protein